MPDRAGAEAVDAYIHATPPEIQRVLLELRALIRAQAPAASERISYAIPTFYLNGNLVHYAAFAHHIGFYPGADGISAFKEELSAYKGGKGSVQFPLHEALPLDLIRRIVAYRVQQNEAKAPRRRSQPTPR
ncbi:MAG: DUF1801 domain-containing protein [Deltaproteobacteria bacterium]|nr:DUF1801 domain-containing protein [Deltaproteobacteria bacterium]